MAVDTTMYIHDTTMDLIKNAVALTGKTRNQMIVILLKRTMIDSRKKIRTGCTIKYQDRDPLKRWKTVHVRFREDEADYFKDLRNFLKRSDSLLLAQAARGYLDEIIRKAIQNQDIDNYPFFNYIISREEAENLIFWHICWGLPEKPEEYFKL